MVAIAMPTKSTHIPDKALGNLQLIVETEQLLNELVVVFVGQVLTFLFSFKQEVALSML
jgi:hypothetical protein